MKFNKKGSLGFLQMIIITIVSFILVAAILGKVLSESSSKEAEIMCRDSVIVRGKLTVNLPSLGAWNQVAHPAPLLCRMIEKEVSGNKDKIMQTIGESMARCWWMFNEGKDRCILENYNSVECELGCFICYNLLIRENDVFQEGDFVSLPELDHYLTKNNYYKFGIPYSQYIRYGTGDQFAASGGLIKPEHVYSIVFMQGAGGEARVFISDPDDTYGNFASLTINQCAK